MRSATGASEILQLPEQFEQYVRVRANSCVECGGIGTMIVCALPEKSSVVFKRSVALVLGTFCFGRKGVSGSGIGSACLRWVAVTAMTLAIALSLASGTRCEAQGTNASQIDFPEAQINVTPATVFRHNTQFSGINDSGTVVGSLFTESLPPGVHPGAGMSINNWQAFVYRAGKFTIIEGPLSKQNPTRAIAINNRGQILIRQDAADGYHYFLYEPANRTFRPVSMNGRLSVGGAAPFRLTEITGINDRGQISGFVQNGAGVRGTPAMGAPGALAPPPTGGVFTGVGCPGKPVLLTGGINNFGEVAGSCDGGKTAFVAKRDGTVATFAGPTPRWFFNNGMGINDAGDVVGYSHVNASQTGFLYRRQQLTQLPGLGAVEINSHGQVVGMLQEGRLHFSAFLTQMQP
jgi:uncharacterized membrane protein